MNKVKLLFLIFFLPFYVLPQDGGNRRTDMITDWSVTRGIVGSNITDSKVFDIYMDIESGPYLENSWFKGYIDSPIFQKEGPVELSFRYDLLNQKIHYIDPNEGDMFEFPDNMIKGFTILEKNGNLRVFKKVESDLFPYPYGNVRYVESLYKDSLVVANTSKLSTYTPKPPLGDGKPTARYVNNSGLFASGDYKAVKANPKALSKLFPQLEDEINTYHKKQNRIKSIDTTREFFDFIQSNE